VASGARVGEHGHQYAGRTGAWPPDDGSSCSPCGCPKSGLLTDSEQQVVHLLATAAATGLLHRRAVHQRDTVNDQLRHALASRTVIEQAKGFLAARCDLSPELAFTLMRSYARAQRKRLTEVAQTVVDGDVVIP
jgi:ANTAR domain